MGPLAQILYKTTLIYSMVVTNVPVLSQIDYKEEARLSFFCIFLDPRRVPSIYSVLHKNLLNEEAKVQIPVIPSQFPFTNESRQL